MNNLVLKNTYLDDIMRKITRVRIYINRSVLIKYNGSPIRSPQPLDDNGFPPRPLIYITQIKLTLARNIVSTEYLISAHSWCCSSSL